MYLCLDMAINTAYPVLPLQKLYPVNRCLFTGTDDENLWDAGPWLFQLNNQDFHTIVTDPLITFHHSFIIDSVEPFDFLVTHLQQFLYKTINNRQHYYRFWDARVLLSEIKQFSEEQLNKFFHTYIQAIYIEDGSKENLLKLSLNSRQLLAVENCNRSQLFTITDTAPVATINKTEQTNYPDYQPDKPVKKRRFWTE
jgi:hypothetical protein